MKKLNVFGAVILGVAVVMASGCHRKPSSLTPIPGISGPGSEGPTSENQNVPPSNPFPGETNVTGMPIDYGDYGKLINGPHVEDHEKFQADTIYFDFDQATIKPSEEGKLKDIAAYFKGNKTDALKIEGNCDERGTEKYNLSLGERRALAAREYLANLGVDPHRIQTVSYGASRAAVEGHDEAAWSKNRRDEFVLLTPK